MRNPPAPFPTRRTATALLLAVLAVLGVAEAQAAGSLTLRGSVDPDCNVSVQDYSATLNISGGETGVLVGRVREFCNDKDGFSVTFSSANGGLLAGSSGTGVAYELSYSNNNGYRSLATDRVFTRNKQQTNSGWRNVWVRMPANPQAVAGTYADTVTITIAAR